MVLQTAGLFAFVAGAVQQNPVVVQFAQNPVPVLVQTVPESLAIWLLHFLAQLLVSIIPVAGGVCIALWSFKKNRQSEHEQWLRDQKKAEWHELLELLNSSMLPLAKKDHINDDAIKSITSFQLCLSSRIFIADATLEPYRAKMKHFWKEWRQSGSDEKKRIELFPVLLDMGDKLREDARNDLFKIDEAGR